jgi:hypothetical protein
MSGPAAIAEPATQIRATAIAPLRIVSSYYPGKAQRGVFAVLVTNKPGSIRPAITKYQFLLIFCKKPGEYRPDVYQ